MIDAPTDTRYEREPPHCPTCSCGMDSEVARLRGALEKYGHHDEECASENNDQYVGAFPCNCGLDAALKDPQS